MSYSALSVCFLLGASKPARCHLETGFHAGFMLHAAAKQGQILGENVLPIERGTPGEGSPSMGRAGGARAWPGQGGLTQVGS